MLEQKGTLAPEVIPPERKKNMTQNERLDALIAYLLKEDPDYDALRVPGTVAEKKEFLRSLMNVRNPSPVTEEFLKMQDAYLKEEMKSRGIVELSALQPAADGVYIRKGDITQLAVDAVVDAADKELLGCFTPCHDCVDNAIHSAAGVQLRLECALIAGQKGGEVSVAQPEITHGWNLPCKYVIHVVGPVVYGFASEKEREMLALSYRSSLDLALKNDLHSIAFPCISVGQNGFAPEEAAPIAVRTVRDWQGEHPDTMKVVFDVYSASDEELYKDLLTKAK
jgi:O-acetyl-ADP-ribose deacetylase (regulator of RNase III)